MADFEHFPVGETNIFYGLTPAQAQAMALRAASDANVAPRAMTEAQHKLVDSMLQEAGKLVSQANVDLVSRDRVDLEIR